MSRIAAIAAAAAAVVLSAGNARAERVTVGLYAPSAPFSGPSDRLQYVSKLAARLEASAGDGVEVVGRVYARATSFETAVRRGEVQYAVVDAAYAAARRLPYRVLGATTRGGSAVSSWYLVAGPGIDGVADLDGKTVAMPRISARDEELLTSVLLEGEVKRDHFGSVTRTPDSFSAVTMVKLGRAAAAFVPAGVTLPDGVRRLRTLRQVGWPMLVALPGADRRQANRFGKAARGFGDGPLTGLVAPEAGRYKALVASFSPPVRRPIMVAGGAAPSDLSALFGTRPAVIPAPALLEIIEPITAGAETATGE